jgi:prepilin-type N-terminal cleavage/methylation domain-containing protein
MSLESKVQSLKSAAGDAHHAPCIAPQVSCSAPLSRAFTLIEIMIVVGIMGIVMAMSVPIVYKVWRKAPMTQAVKDIVEVCSHARARAIMQGTTTEVIINPKENRIALAGAGSAPQPSPAPGVEALPTTPAAAGSGLSAQLSRDIIIEMLDVNMSGIEFNDAEQVKIRFYPNGVSDEMKMLLFDGRQRMGIDLEITTGLANVVPDPLETWKRR